MPLDPTEAVFEVVRGQQLILVEVSSVRPDGARLSASEAPGSKRLFKGQRQAEETLENNPNIFRFYHPALTVTSQGYKAVYVDTFLLFFLPAQRRGGSSRDKGKKGYMKRAANEAGGAAALWEPTLKEAASCV